MLLNLLFYLSAQNSNYFNKGYNPFSKATEEYSHSSYELPISNLTGNYINDTYVDLHRISTDYFSYNSNGDLLFFPISNAFNKTLNQNKYWSSIEINSTFTSSIYINFTCIVEIEAILYDTAYRTFLDHERKFYGFPNKINIYTSLYDEPLQLNTVFKGETPNCTFWGTKAQYLFNICGWNLLKLALTFFLMENIVLVHEKSYSSEM